MQIPVNIPTMTNVNKRSKETTTSFPGLNKGLNKEDKKPPRIPNTKPAKNSKRMKNNVFNLVIYVLILGVKLQSMLRLQLLLTRRFTQLLV